MVSKLLNLISFFSGAGGLDLGFEAAGFKVRLAVDNMPEACLTLRENDVKRPVFGPPYDSGDINQLSPEMVYQLSKLKPGQIDMIVGGPPCQPFSVAAAQRFLKDDSRFKRVGFSSKEKGQLIFSYVNLICQLKPKAFLIENVPGILSIDGGSGISVVYETLEAAGYTVSPHFVLNTKNYGVPQSRNRAFVIGTLNGSIVSAPEPTHTDVETLFQESYITVSQALFGLSPDTANMQIRNHKIESVTRYKKLQIGERERLGRVDRLDPLKPSKTVIAGGSAGGGRSHLHPYLARTMSVREAARLQTFPDDYIFHGKNGRQFTLVGNAVPPLMAEVLARKILLDCFNKQPSEILKHAYKGPTATIANRKLQTDALQKSPKLIYNSMKK
jgi:DNA (cytosine-5)-methyltransferase 1